MKATNSNSHLGQSLGLGVLLVVGCLGVLALMVFESGVMAN
jgi:hypothetical protein